MKKNISLKNTISFIFFSFLVVAFSLLMTFLSAVALYDSYRIIQESDPKFLPEKFESDYSSYSSKLDPSFNWLTYNYMKDCYFSNYDRINNNKSIELFKDCSKKFVYDAKNFNNFESFNFEFSKADLNPNPIKTEK